MFAKHDVGHEFFGCRSRLKTTSSTVDETLLHVAIRVNLSSVDNVCSGGVMVSVGL